MNDTEINKKDKHVEVICKKKFELYKSEMDKEFLGSSLAEIIVGSICMILIFGFIWL